MKYIKRYNESKVDILSDIRDICLEVEDLGYKTTINCVESRSNCTVYRIRCYMDRYRIIQINWNEVKDCFLRLQDYLEANLDKRLNHISFYNIDENMEEKYNIK